MKSDQISDRQKMHVADTLCNCMEAIGFHKPTGKIMIFSGHNGDDLYRTLHELHLELRRLKQGDEVDKDVRSNKTRDCSTV